MLIYMFLSPGSVDSESQLFPGQGTLQVLLLLLALVCVPWMLCAKPYILYREHKKIKGQGYHALEPRESSELDGDAEPNGEATHEEMAEDTHVRRILARGKRGRWMADPRGNRARNSISARS
jgi:V-type H+-transporting ATPase subunit a